MTSFVRSASSNIARAMKEVTSGGLSYIPYAITSLFTGKITASLPAYMDKNPDSILQYWNWAPHFGGIATVALLGIGVAKLLQVRSQSMAQRVPAPQ